MAKIKEKRQGELLFSVVIPSYNYANTLPNAIQSVLSQQGDDFDLLVIDDGSTDNTVEVVESILVSHPERFRFVRQKNAGPAATRNLGIDETHGRYLIFLDADDEMMPNALTHCRNRLMQDDSVGMLAGAHIAKSSSGSEKLRPTGFISSHPEKNLRSYLLQKTLAFSNGAVAISREVFENYRYPEHFRASEDISMFAFILVKYKVLAINEPLAVINKHSSSLRHNVAHATSVGVDVVDEVFAPERIPKELLGLRNEYMSQRCLSLFRTFFLAGKYQEAKMYYRRAIRINPVVIFRLTYLVKYFKLNLKLMFQLRLNE